MPDDEELKPGLARDFAHARACHERWIQRLNRDGDSAHYPDEWFGSQCGACRFFIPLTGALIEDWGACSNPQSPFDGRVMFEHDGCDAFDEASDAWGTV